MVPPRAVAALFLRRQHLAEPRARSLTTPRLLRFVEDAGGIQMDSINVVERAHYLAVWSRFGPYDRALLDHLVYDRRLCFEYWGHAACLVATSTLAAWRRAMLDYRVRHTGWSGWLRRNDRVLRRVRAAVAEAGPMAAADFESRRRPPGGAGWWRWGPIQHALHYLWMTGAVTVHSRRHFQKRFDLFERAIPNAGEIGPMSSEAFARWHVERSLFAMGAATERDLSRYLSFPRFAPRARRAALAAMIEAGEVTEVTVEDARERWLALSRDVRVLRRAADGRASSGTTLLSPFDSLLWVRERLPRLFGFDYRIEVYTPAAKRVHGYYLLPILHDGELIGRLDAKADRAAKRLEVRHAHLEPWFAAGRPSPIAGVRIDRDAALAGLGEALDSLATFVGAERVILGRVTPARFARALPHSRLRGRRSADI